MRLIRRLVSVLLPWPQRHERHAAIQAARAEKERSRRGAADAQLIAAQIEQIASDDDFAANIAEQIISRHGKRS